MFCWHSYCHTIQVEYSYRMQVMTLVGLWQLIQYCADACVFNFGLRRRPHCSRCVTCIDHNIQVCSIIFLTIISTSKHASSKHRLLGIQSCHNMSYRRTGKFVVWNAVDRIADIKWESSCYWTLFPRATLVTGNILWDLVWTKLRLVTMKMYWIGSAMEMVQCVSV